jgi:hypothetical protein
MPGQGWAPPASSHQAWLSPLMNSHTVRAQHHPCGVLVLQKLFIMDLTIGHRQVQYEGSPTRRADTSGDSTRHCAGNLPGSQANRMRLLKELALSTRAAVEPFCSWQWEELPAGLTHVPFNSTPSLLLVRWCLFSAWAWFRGDTGSRYEHMPFVFPT